jgi:hypothetical protein
MNAELRDELNRTRYERLRRQIGALQAAVEELGLPRNHWEWTRRFKLQRKIERLRRECGQPMLFLM